jgi:hypothetical protein
MIFGRVPVEPIKIVRFLWERLDKKKRVRQSGKDKYRAWTRAVKETLKELVEEHGKPYGRALVTSSRVVQQIGKARKADARRVPTREFLLDFVWWEDEKTQTSGRAVMGVECEWASWHGNKRASEVLYDFEKLLSFKAPLKLLIFECRNPRERKHLHKKFCLYLKAFQQHVRGECYLFVEFSRGGCIAHSYKVKQSATVSKVKLKLLLRA